MGEALAATGFHILLLEEHDVLLPVPLKIII